MKKGFTLIELIAVVVILAVISMIVFPNINEVIFSSREKLYNSQIQDIEKAAEKWATDHMDLLDKYYLNVTYVSLANIQATGYLEKENIKNPLTKENMNGCIQIKYDINKGKYNYQYQEESCKDYATKENDDTLGYVIYEYDSKQNKIIESSDSNKLIPTGQYIYNWYVERNMIYSDGQELDGLYELDDKYVFRGNNVNNYVEFAGKTWRILSINKKDFSIKLIGITSVSNQFDTAGGIEFKNASSNIDILKKETFDTAKILLSDFKTDIINGTEVSRRTLDSTLGKSVTNLEIGLISVMDYVDASATLECTNNYLSPSCTINNYLYTMFGSTSSTWTLNSNGIQVWYIDADGLLKLGTSTDIKQLYPVINISSNTYIINTDVAVGSTSSPYKIK